MFGNIVNSPYKDLGYKDIEFFVCTISLDFEKKYYGIAIGSVGSGLSPQEKT